MSTRHKKKLAHLPYLFIASIVWFIVISYLIAHTKYPGVIADHIADSQGTSTTLEGVLDTVIVLCSFLPSALALAYIYIDDQMHNDKPKVLKVLLSSFAITLALYIPFSWYNFIVNFPR